MRSIRILLATIILSVPVFAQKPLVYATNKDKEIFDDYIKCVSSEKLQPEELIIATASFFLDVPYVAATLEKEPEGLVINLREMDCTTFVENVFALSKTVLAGESTFDDFCRNLRQLRYRNGEIDGYADRLHYTTDWLYENERKGLVKDITKEIGGELLDNTVYFMSRNADKYKQLKDNPELTAKIASIEKEINKRTYFYIPQDKIDDCGGLIRNGDMVCFVTSIGGLDISHVGIARRVSGQLTFMHASSSGEKVIVEPRSMQEYTQAISKNTGVVIARPLFRQNNSKANLSPRP